ncbi:MAG: pyridoxamine 5'-phosphate oxidase family protein [Chloroflexi bacterium]|nr:pyridoxamine 5'-phosphate oxidase family protein [Chloroflexota bacterium]MBV9595627.1 pyridoxamine 5'-phosphate oxidase family protein [Chloroflexota bacterium]
MPGYGTLGPDDGGGLLPWSWAEEQLTRSRTFWLATRWPDGRPHVMPVWAIWHDQTLLFSSSKRSRKARNLANDPRCVLTTDDPQNAVVVEGVAELITERQELEAFLAAENAKYATTYGFEMVDPSANSCFRLKPSWAFGLRAENFAGSPTRWRF